MKFKLLFISVFLLGSITLSAQENFRRDYFYISVYENGEWSESEEGDNTFVFNANARGDIFHYTASGKKWVYRKLSDPEEGYTDETYEHYQVLVILDEKGNEVILQLFDNKEIGLKLIFNADFMIQFHNIK